MTAATLKQLALDAGFDLAGIAPASDRPEWPHYMAWVSKGMAGRMGYLTDHRAEKRRGVTAVLPSARSVLVVGQLYNAPLPYSTSLDDSAKAWISRYAWGEDYHGVMRAKLERVAAQIEGESKICIDTAPVLERALARDAGLGWIGKNACLINQHKGSWFFLGELITPLALEADAPPPDRCGSCTRCIDACPTQAIVPTGVAKPAYEVDARLCIAYLNIELKGAVSEQLRPSMGQNVFGCDICQDVCPWNRRAAETHDDPWQPRLHAPPLEQLALLTEAEFRALYKGSPIARTKYEGFLRNVAIAMGNARRPEFRAPLERLAALPDEVIASHARWALELIR
ncbi:MAG: tRNA epoxyqueuosine(34) reductase QueG [Acidobacteria bacterium]|nr:tRNA epoxyqueuosine(34) reductase QueG [Acidobacteriota bacterium]